jgi:glycerol-3-phosphate dehydrogenase
MYKVRIIGAGSIGNHLANSFINNDFYVEITDMDPSALARTKNEIYPSRYGSWDERIKIVSDSESEFFETDVLVIGTPPSTHLEIALQQLKKCSPSIILIEKPISHPIMENFAELEKLDRYSKTLTQINCLSTPLYDEMGEAVRKNIIMVYPTMKRINKVPVSSHLLRRDCIQLISGRFTPASA